jgi:hypothetical protein
MFFSIKNHGHANQTNTEPSPLSKAPLDRKLDLLRVAGHIYLPTQFRLLEITSLCFTSDEIDLLLSGLAKLHFDIDMNTAINYDCTDDLLAVHHRKFINMRLIRSLTLWPWHLFSTVSTAYLLDIAAGLQ